MTETHGFFTMPGPKTAWDSNDKIMNTWFYKVCNMGYSQQTLQCLLFLLILVKKMIFFWLGCLGAFEHTFDPREFILSLFPELAQLGIESGILHSRPLRELVIHLLYIIKGYLSTVNG